jgi:hypothetical protein
MCEDVSEGDARVMAASGWVDSVGLRLRGIVSFTPPHTQSGLTSDRSLPPSSSILLSTLRLAMSNRSIYSIRSETFCPSTI